MSNKEIHNRDEMKDLRRYIEGKMSEKERNAFERELQKDEFMNEAIDGLSELSPQQVESDLGTINTKLDRRVYKRKPLYYRIAAAVVVLLGISSVLLVRQLGEPDIIVSEVLMESEDTITKKMANTEDLSEHRIKSIAREVETEPGIEEAEPEAVEPIQIDKKDKELAILDYAVIQDDNLSIQEVIDTVTINRHDTVAPLPQVPLAAAEREQAKAVQVSQALESEQVSRSRKMAGEDQPVAVKEAIAPEKGERYIDEDAKGKTEVISVTSADEKYSGDRGPEPEGGMKYFREYLRSDQIFPPRWERSEREVVKLSITIDSYGEIGSIEILKSPGDNFSEEATRLIEEGPPWSPAVRNGTVVNESVIVRIVFRR